LRVIEADRQDDAVDILGFAEDAMREDAEIAAHLAQDMAQHQPVEDPVGMVGDQDQWPVFRDVVETAADDVEAEPVAFHHHLTRNRGPV
jgi:hypothetical protein